MNQSENENPKPHLSVLDKIDKILLKCDDLQRQAKRSDIWFSLVEIQNNSTNPLPVKPSYPLGKAKEVFLITPKELDFQKDEEEYLEDLLKKEEYIECETYLDSRTRQKHLVDYELQKGLRITVWQLSIEGYKRIVELRQSIDSKQVFIAMWFDPSMDNAWKKIESTFVNYGFQLYRVDKDEHNENISFKIIAEIKRSKFLIADFTSDRGGVYWEAGFAKGLGREVIPCMKKSEFDKQKPHFEVQQINFILWEDEEDSSKKLIDRIRATID